MNTASKRAVAPGEENGAFHAPYTASPAGVRDSAHGARRAGTLDTVTVFM